MIVEFDGTEHEVEDYIQKTKEIAEKNNSSIRKPTISNYQTFFLISKLSGNCFHGI